jgi:hypothetical protein
MFAHDYEAMAREASGRGVLAIEYLDAALPDLWLPDYRAMPGGQGKLLKVTFGDESLKSAFCRYAFHEAPGQQEHRVVAVWGISRREAAATRDKARMAGFLKGAWKSRFGKDDRGHFFAHTMGGGLDINLFPQDRRLNRGTDWRELEQYCATHPGTFCFVRAIYADLGWRPSALEYGIFKQNIGRLTFWGRQFSN